MSDQAPTCWIIAGPNGAGKTTFALKYLPEIGGCRNFVNADLIAAGMSPLAPETERVAAGRVFLSEIRRYISLRLDFAFETTLAGLGYRRLIQQLKADGWRVELIYLALPGVEMAKYRVAERVAHGGHDIPDVDIGRRFKRSLAHLFNVYGELVHRTVCFMNSGDIPEVVFRQESEKRVVIQSDLMNALVTLR